MAAKSLLSKRIPTAFGLVILLSGLVAGVFLVGKTQSITTNAGPTSSPRNVRVVNSGAGGFSVTWTTDSPVTGFVKYSDNPGKLNLTGGDTRDQRSGNVSSYTTHFVEIVGLSPNANYYFEVGSGGAIYNDNGKPYQTRTTAQAVPSEDLISGKILLTSGLGAGGVIVYVEMDKTETMAALTKDDGTWRLPLSMARDKQGQLVSYDPEKTQLTLFAQGGNMGTATALTTTKNDSPVPDITLGKTHNFNESNAAATPEVSETTAATNGFSGLAANANDASGVQGAGTSIKLLNPETDGEKIATGSPEIRGRAPAGTALKITVNSQVEQVANLVVDNSGEWSYTPPAGLEPGNHTIAVEYLDKNGVLQTLTRHFTVLAADNTGGLPAFTATPSATPAVTSTPSATPTLAVGTSSAIATESSRSAVTATSSGLPDVGLLTPTYTLLLAGLGLFLGGLIWKKKVNSWINTS